MFEDSTFESTGRIKTRSRRWMLAAFTLNGSILVALILIPLIYPGALPGHVITPLLVAPAAPQPQNPQPVRVRSAAPHNFSDMMGRQLIVPTIIPNGIKKFDGPEPDFVSNIGLELGPAGPGIEGADPFGTHRPVIVVHPDIAKPIHVSSSLIAGLLVYKNIPQYPVIPKTMGVQGTVVLQATISKNGTIENLRVLSGPPLLQQAALDAVKTWRYRPYMLNQQPVEVDTTVNVVFTLQH